MLLGTKVLVAFSLFFNQPVPPYSDYDDSSGYIQTDEGIQIHYDNKAMDGGIDYDPELTELSNLDNCYEKEIRTSGAKGMTETHATVPITFQTQLYNNYCGPAAVKMLLSGIGISSNQSTIATAIGTDASGTSFGNSLLQQVNSMASSAGITFYLVWHSSTNTATLKTNFVSAIEGGNPVLINTDESDYFRFNGHATHNIKYHYGCVNGFTNSGEYFRYNDPASGFSGWTDIPQAAYYSKTVISGACGGRGYIW
jgi:hypothetical protein